MVLHTTSLTESNLEETLDNIVFDNPTVDEKYGNVSVRLSVTHDGEKKPLLLETPWMKAFVGINRFEPQGANKRPKFKIPLAFHKEDTYDRQQVYKQFFESLDEKMVEEGHANAGPWIKRAGEPKAVIKAFYSPSLSYSKTKTGEINTEYPPRVQFKLGTYQNDDGSIRFAAPVYKDKDTKLEDPLVAVQKGCEVKAIVECTGVWSVSGKFGLGWRVVQLKVKERKNYNTYAFCDDSDDDIDDEEHVDKEKPMLSDEDEEEVVAKPPTPPTSPVKKRRGGRKRATAKKKSSK